MIQFKSITKYLVTLIAFCAFISCSDQEPVSQIVDSGSAVLDGENIILRGSVTLPETLEVTTRSMSDMPDLSNLHLYAVEFIDAKDPLVNNFIRVYEAENETVSGDQVSFSITLRSTTLPRILHLIALPKNVKLKVEKGIEGVVIPALITQGNVDAYWRRLEFPDGYCVETAGTWSADPALIAKMTRVPLIRNYSKFTMKNEASGFTLLGFKLINTPSQGSIAAWNPITRKFVDFLDRSDNDNPLDYSRVAAIYDGLYPAGTAIENQILPPAGTVIENNADGAEFMYERPFSENARTYMIIKGMRNGKTFYYKLDIGKNDDDGIFRYYNILRNFNYKVVIKTVAADGYESVSEAASGSVFNNISFDVELEKLTNMSNGAEIVYVDYTSNILTSSTEETVKFSYRYKNIATNKFNNSGTKLVDFKPGSVIKSVGVPVDDADGFKTVEFTCYPAVAETKIQKFIVIKPSTGLGRTVTLISHLKWDIGTTRVYPESLDEYGTANSGCLPAKVGTKTIGNPFTIFFDLSDDIPEVVFPLEFILESKEQIMENQPGTGSMPVKSGVSLFNSNITAIQYKREVTWTDYNLLRTEGGIKLTNGKRRVVCNFRTTKPVTDGTKYTFRISNINFKDLDITVNKAVDL